VDHCSDRRHFLRKVGSVIATLLASTAAPDNFVQTTTFVALFVGLATTLAAAFAGWITARGRGVSRRLAIPSYKVTADLPDGSEVTLEGPDPHELSRSLEQLLERAKQDQRDAAQRRMKAAMQSEQHLWRTIDRLAVIGGVSEAEALEILRADPEVVLGRGKSGNQIARLASRPG
jgi:hypothetical protein